MFSAETYQRRRAQLMRKVEKGVILLLGNALSAMNYADNTYRFRQDSNFLYYIGLDEPGLAALLDVDQGVTTIFGTELTLDDIVWTGAQPSLAEKAALAGIDQTEAYTQLPAFLADITAVPRKIHILPPYRPENKVKLSSWLNVSARQLMQLPSSQLIHAVVDQRLVKEPQEIKQMEQALDVTCAMHIAAMQQARTGVTEAQLAGIVEGIALASGGATSYPVIMTVNGQVLHNHGHHNTLGAGQLVLGDFGAETSMHYAADITRTFPVDRTFSTVQKEIYQAVLNAQEAVIEQMRPGVFNLALHKLATLHMAKSLKEIGLLKGDMEEAVEAGAVYLFFPHGLGHPIGLDVHDMEDLGESYVGYTSEVTRPKAFGIKALRFGRKLQPGYVMTVEPGLYFIPELMDQWESEKKHADFINYKALSAFRSFSGVRIEDDVLITATGKRVLGTPIPKTIAEVEHIRAQAIS
ncbi:MAG: aminopeptidase P family protein [Saprospiraceae bacterium]|nr:aminopeptidase P family protein [Saprospiraceae bacterium]